MKVGMMLMSSNDFANTALMSPPREKRMEVSSTVTQTLNR